MEQKKYVACKKVPGTCLGDLSRVDGESVFDKCAAYFYEYILHRKRMARRKHKEENISPRIKLSQLTFLIL